MSELTLVMLTYNRPQYALRQAKIWANNSFVHLLILDGSSVANEAIINSAYSNVEYVQKPINIQERLALASKMIRTEFAAIIGDDDIFLESGLQACVDELKLNSSLVACLGSALSFVPRGDTVYFDHIYEGARKRSILFDDTADRIDHHFKEYFPTTVYAVIRTNVWKNAMLVASKAQYSCVYLSELLFELSVTLQGKSKVISRLMWLRSDENPPIHEKNWNRKLTFLDWFTHPQYSQEVIEFEETAVKSMVDLIGIDEKRVKQYFSQMIRHFLLFSQKRKKSFWQKVLTKLKIIFVGIKDTAFSTEDLPRHLMLSQIPFDALELNTKVLLLQWGQSEKI